MRLDRRLRDPHRRGMAHPQRTSRRAFRRQVAHRTSRDRRWRALAGGWAGAAAPGRRPGRAPPPLDACLDVDLESSAMTNALPVHRLNLATGERAQAPAAYV